MGTRIAVAISLLVVAGCGGPAGIASHEFEDPEVTRIHSRMIDVMAPDNGWEQARYIEFDWAVGQNVRSHRWDRWEGLARYQTLSGGSQVVAIFDTDDPTSGRVWVDGIEATGEDAVSRLEGAYRAHINDSYWLIMPYKWADPGVHTRYLGEQTDEEGRTWEVVELSFESDAGLTPQNLYHAFVNPETGRMERWHHFSNEDADPSPSDWTDWQRYGPIELPENRMVDGVPRIFFPHIRVETSVPEGVFDPPAE
jgi:hypothetical protein